MNSAKPFIKWVGGKTQLLNDINDNLPVNISDIETYIEPFIGGGAVLFDIVPKLPNVKRVIINDLNYKLTNTYSVIKNNHEELINTLFSIQTDYFSESDKLYYDEKTKRYRANKEQMFYTIRDSFNTYNINDTDTESKIKHAAEFIFLNKTGFNGLYRENAKGLFNVPWNKSDKPTICDKENIIAVHDFLNKYNVEILTGYYNDIFEHSYNNLFVYFDPPYRPITKSSAFTSYTKSGFNDDEQIKLKDCCDSLNNQGHRFMLSNSDPKNTDVNDNFFDDLYNDYNIIRINARRNINSKGNGRGCVSEILIKNF